MKNEIEKAIKLIADLAIDILIDHVFDQPDKGSHQKKGRKRKKKK